jgi:hypothetical protein
MLDPSLPGLTRQSIFFAKAFLRRKMDPRVKPAGDRLVRVESDEPENALAASAQLLGFRLLSALEIIVRLQEEKPGTLPIADCTCLL